MTSNIPDELGADGAQDDDYAPATALSAVTRLTTRKTMTATDEGRRRRVCG